MDSRSIPPTSNKVKEKLCIRERKNYNMGSGKQPMPPCHPEIEEAIKDAFSHFSDLTIGGSLRRAVFVLTIYLSLPSYGYRLFGPYSYGRITSYQGGNREFKKCRYTINLFFKRSKSLFFL